MFMVKSVDAVPEQLEKVVANAAAYIEFSIKLHITRFLFIFIFCKNYEKEMNYKNFKTRCYFSIAL